MTQTGVRDFSDRDIILIALNTFIMQLEELRKENTYSSQTEARLKAARRAYTHVNTTYPKDKDKD